VRNVPGRPAPTTGLVGLGEWHSLQNHYDALTLLLTDPRLPEVVDDIEVEFGNTLYQDTIDRFIAGQPVDDADLHPVWRNTTQSPLETYDEPIYEQFFRTVRAVNWTLPPGMNNPHPTNCSSSRRHRNAARAHR
jgi:hypothetical protein